MGVLPRVGAAWRRIAHRRELAQIIQWLPGILPSIEQQMDVRRGLLWTVRDAQWTRTDVAVVALGPPDHKPLAMLKVAHAPDGVERLQRQQRMVSALLADPRVTGWEKFVPRQIASGSIAGRPYIVEHALVGSDGRQLAYDPCARRCLLRTAAHAINELHQRTTTSLIVDDAQLNAWIDEPVLLLQSLVARSPSADRAHLSARLREAAEQLRRALPGRVVDVSWIHGDFWVGNFLAEPSGVHLNGIVDWDGAQPDGLPMHDILDLLLHTRRVLALEGELTNTLLHMLGRPCWTTDERVVLEAADLPLPRDAAGYHAMFILYWLRYISRYLRQYPHRARDSRWVTRHIYGVLGCL
jgi:hypothetical protein